MKNLIENDDVILNGTKTRHQAEKDAFNKLGLIEQILTKHNIKTLKQLDQILTEYPSIHDAFLELRFPYEESQEIEMDGETYFARRTARFNECSDNENSIVYNYYVYKWDKTYFETELPLISDDTLKIKNWQEVFHAMSYEKFPPKDLIYKHIKEGKRNGENKIEEQGIYVCRYI